MTPSPRVRLQFPIEFRKNYARDASFGFLKNVSLTGAFLETTGVDFSTSEKVRITLRLSGREREITAKVVWTNERGAGIEFLPSAGRDTQIVDDLMYFVTRRDSSRRHILESIFENLTGDTKKDAA